MSKPLSSSASPSARRRLQGPGGGHGCSMFRSPGPYNRHCQRIRREWSLLRDATRPSRQGPLPRILVLVVTPTHAQRFPGPRQQRTAERGGLDWVHHFRLRGRAAGGASRGLRVVGGSGTLSCLKVCFRNPFRAGCLSLVVLPLLQCIKPCCVAFPTL